MKKNKSLSKIYKECFLFIKESKNYIYSGIFLFFFFSLIGFFTTPPKMLEDQILQLLKELVFRFENLGLFATIWEIFSNNLTASFFALIFGVFFGIFPLITSIFNGYLVGYVANKAVAIDGVLTLWRLLPHGIFELPAIFISIGFGLRIGLSIIKEPENFGKIFKNSLKSFIWVVFVLLVIAAIIEGFLIFFFK